MWKVYMGKWSEVLAAIRADIERPTYLPAYLDSSVTNDTQVEVFTARAWGMVNTFLLSGFVLGENVIRDIYLLDTEEHQPDLFFSLREPLQVSKPFVVPFLAKYMNVYAWVRPFYIVVDGVTRYEETSVIDERGTQQFKLASVPYGSFGIGGVIVEWG